MLQYLEKSLKGQIIMDKLSNNFDLLTNLKIILKNRHPPSYSQYIELDVLSREMMDYACPTRVEWRSIYKYGNKFHLHGS